MDQGSPHKTRYTETIRGESEKEPQTHWHRGEFPEQSPMAYALRSTIDKWDLIKLKSFCKAKVTINKTKWQPTHWEKIFTNPKFDRGIIVRASPQLSSLGSRLGCILELKEKRESRRVEREMEPRQYSDQGSALMSANTLYKEEGRPIPSHAKFL